MRVCIARVAFMFAALTTVTTAISEAPAANHQGQQAIPPESTQPCQRLGGVPCSRAVIAPPSWMPDTITNNWINLTPIEQLASIHFGSTRSKFPNGVIFKDSDAWRVLVEDRSAHRALVPGFVEHAQSALRNRSLTIIEAMDNAAHMESVRGEISGAVGNPKVYAGMKAGKASVDAMGKVALKQSFNDIGSLAGLGGESKKRWDAAANLYSNALVERARDAMDTAPEDMKSALSTIYGEARSIPGNVGNAIGSLIDALFADINEMIEMFRADLEAGLNRQNQDAAASDKARIEDALNEALRDAQALREARSHRGTGDERILKESTAELSAFTAEAEALVRRSHEVAMAQSLSLAQQVAAMSQQPLSPKNTTTVCDVQVNLLGTGWTIVRGVDEQEAQSLMAHSRAITVPEAQSRIHKVGKPYSL